MSEIPIWLAVEPIAGDGSSALVLTAERREAKGFALVRHAAAAAVAQSGGCSCCRVPSGLSQVLRQLFLDRVRGAAAFDSIIVAAADEAPILEAMTDPLVAARYAYKGPYSR
jgi:hypothetical protein